jgi:uncharacterized protein (TIGR03663 family)
VQQAALFSYNKIRHFFTFERVFLLILIIAFILRFWQLDIKLLHHDEAIHSWFSYQLLTKNTWIYDPSYHGPFLYFVTAGMFSALGASDLVARLLPALFGFLLIPLVFCIYRLGYINRTQTLIVSLFIALSPDMIYFSRFLRHDIFMLFFTFLLVVALFYYFERGQFRFAFIAAIATAGALCCKEEMPVLLLIIGSYFLISIWRGRYSLPPRWKRDLIVFALLVVALCCTLYTGFWGHPETIVGENFNIVGADGVHFDYTTTGWYQAIDHWTEMHNMQRLGGPWFFYLPLNLLYELPIFILAIVGMIQILFSGSGFSLFYRRTRNWITFRQFQLSTGDLAAVSMNQLNRSQHTNVRSEEFFRFCLYWMLLTMALYAYVGEKVPWLIIPQLLPMCFVAVYKLNWQKIALALVGCIFLIVITWHVAFIPADINEPIVQVQNSEDMREVMQLMETSDKVIIASKDYWPLPWYFRGDRWDKITLFSTVPEENKLTENNPGVIILHDTESLPSIEGYDKKTFKLSYWFSYYDNDKRLPDYYLHRDGKMGSINIDVFTPS